MTPGKRFCGDERRLRRGSATHLASQERAPGLHDLAPALQHVATGVALLDLTADRVGQGLLRQLSDASHSRQQNAPEGFEGGAAGPPSLAPRAQRAKRA